MCKSIAGCLLIIINVLFLCVASALIIFGALLQWGGNVISQIIPQIASLSGGNMTISMTDLSNIMSGYVSVLSNAGLIIFIIGIILFVICICGACGVCFKNGILMIIYLALTLVILVAVVIFIIIFFTKRDEMKNAGNNEYTKLLKDKYVFDNSKTRPTGSGLDVSGIIDVLQARFSCCGSFNSSDFFGNTGYNKDNNTIPFSCCKMKGQTFEPEDKNCTIYPTTNNTNMNTGCYDKVWGLIEQYSKYAAYGLIALGGILLILVIIAGVLQKKFREKD